MLTGNQPTANVQFYSSDYIEQSFGRLARIFVHISNYTKSVVNDNHALGIPAQRPLFMEFPADDISPSVTYQYMYGSDLLVAPVIQPKVTNMNVYLPPGDWKYIWDAKEYSGHGFHTVEATMGKPPAFYKKNSFYATMFSKIQTKFPPLPPTPTTSPPSTHSPSCISRGTSSWSSVSFWKTLHFACAILYFTKLNYFL